MQWARVWVQQTRSSLPNFDKPFSWISVIWKTGRDREITLRSFMRGSQCRDGAPRHFTSRHGSHEHEAWWQ
jgi:hypothetical protein